MGRQGGAAWELGAAEIPGAVPQTPLEVAKAALATTTQPHSLPCRDMERTRIREFLLNALHSGAPPL